MKNITRALCFLSVLLLSTHLTAQTTETFSGGTNGSSFGNPFAATFNTFDFTGTTLSGFNAFFRDDSNGYAQITGSRLNEVTIKLTAGGNFKLDEIVFEVANVNTADDNITVTGYKSSSFVSGATSTFTVPGAIGAETTRDFSSISAFNDIDEIRIAIADDGLFGGIRIESITTDTAGAACSAPTAQATSAIFGSETSSTLNLTSFTAPAGDPVTGYAIYINDTNTFTAPTDGTSPTADTSWNGAGQQAVYFGTSASPNITVSALDSNTTYYFQIYAYNDCSGTETYETTGLNTNDTTAGTTGTVDITEASINPGDSFTITVSDADLNTNTGAAETVDVEVDNTTTGENETVTLTETGNNTGIFTATLATTFGTTAGTNDNANMNVQAGDGVTVTYTDANPSATPTDSVTITGGNTGTIDITEASINPGDSFTITVTDADLNTNTGAAETVDIEVDNTTTGENETVTLTETGNNTGIFTASLATTFGTTAGTNDNANMNVQAGDGVTASYSDTFTANGGTAAPTDSVTISGGTTGSIDITEASINPGDSFTITVTDADLNTNTGAAETVDIEVDNTTTGENETVTLTETGNNTGIFTATLATTFGTTAGTNDNANMNVQAGDGVTASYSDTFTASGGTAAPTDSVTISGGTTGSIDITEASINPGDSFTITVTDADLNTNTGAAETVDIEVDNTTTGENETVTLTETGNNTGIFTATLATTFGTTAGTNDNANMNVQAGDGVTASYSDTFTASGGTAAPTDSVTINGGTTGSIDITEASINPGDSFTITVTDTDLNTNTGAAETVDIEVDNTTTGENETVTLTETGNNTGIFTATLATTFGTTSGTNDNANMNVQAGDGVTASYSDTLTASGGTAAPTDSVTINGGTTGTIDITEASINEGESFTITVTDADLNTNTGAAETVDIEVDNTTTGENETVTLTETGNNTGIFTATLATTSGTTAGTNDNGNLNVQAGDGVTASYADVLIANGGTAAPTDSVIITALIELTISGLTGDNKVYDGTTAATVSGSGSLVGVVGGDDVSLTGTPVYTFVSANVGTSITINVSGVSLTGADAGKYTLTQPTLSGDITAAGLTVVGLTGDNKVYDGTTAATASGTETLSGVIGADDVVLGGSGSYTFASANVGTGITINTTGFTISGTDSGNYTLTQPTLSADITAAELTVVGLTGDNKVYDGTTAATASGTETLSGVIGADDVTLGGSGVYTFASANVGTGITINTTGFTISGTDSGNYTLTQPTLSADITAAELTVVGLTGDNKTYDGTTAATASGTETLSGVIGADDVTLGGSGVYTFASANVGTGITINTTGFTISGTDSGNYTLTQPTLSADITAAELTVVGLTGDNKVYDGTTAATASGTETLSGVIGADDVTLGGSGVYTFASANVGTGITINTTGFTISGTDSGNYTLTQPTLSADITAAELTVVGLTGDNKVYDGTTAATASGTETLSGVIGADDVVLGGSGVYTFATANVGTGITINTTGFTLSGTDSGNYTLTQPTLSADITAAELTVVGLTGDNKVYDGTTAATASGTETLSGVIGADDVVLDGSGVYTFASANVGAGITINTTGFTISGTDSGNYTLTQPTLSADITAAELTVVGLTGDNKVYDGTTAATASGTETLSGVIGADDVTLGGSGVYTFASANVGTGITINTVGFTISGTDSGNYTLTQPTLSGDITAAELTVVGLTGDNKVYDGTTAATASGTETLSGVIGADDVTLGGSGVYTFASTNVGTGITINTVGFTISGTDSGNYTLTQPTLSADITAAELTVVGLTGDNKTYDGTTAATASGTETLSGVIGADDVTLGGSGVYTFASANVGTGITINTTGFTISGTDSGNYTLTQPTLSGDITAAELIVVGLTGDNKVYDGTTAATASGTETLSGVIGADDVTLGGSGVYTFASANVGTGITINTTGFTISGTDSGNYTLTQPTLSADITAAELIVVGLTGDNKVYDGTTAATASGTETLSGVIGADDVTLGGSGVYTFASANVGTGITINTTGFTISGTDSGNYTLTQPTLSGDITAAELTVVGLTGDNKVYDGTTAATASGTETLSGVIGADDVTLGGSGVYTFASANVGTGITINTTGFTISGTDSGNYTLTQPTLSADITAAELTVVGLTGDNKVYDGTTAATASGTETLSGVIGADDVTLGGSGVYTFASANVGTGITINTTGFTISGTDSGNYTLTQPTLSGDITAAELTVVGLVGDDKVYDTTTAATTTGTETLSGVFGSDDVTLGGSGVYTFASANVGTGITINTVGFTISGTDSGNYTLTQPTLSGDITAAELTVVGLVGDDKVYDTTTAATATGTETLSGVIGADDVSLGGSPVFNFVSPDPGTGITINTTGFTISGTDSGNYTLTQPTLSADIFGPEISFNSLTSNALENTGSANIAVDLSVAVPITVTVDYTVTGGTATAADYTLANGTLTFNANDTSVDILVTILDELMLEPDETVEITLSNPSPLSTLGANTVHTFTITNDDSAAVTIEDVSGNEDDGDMTFTATLDNPVQGGFTVDVSSADGTAEIADSDYVAIFSETLTFIGTSGETQTFTFTPNVDAKVESDETVTISQDNLANTALAVTITDTAIATITNDDSTEVTINADVDVDEDAGFATLVATLSNPVQGGFFINVTTADGTAVAPGDYTASNDQPNTDFVGLAGETQNLSIPIIDDSEGELSETFTVTLTSVSGTTLGSFITTTDAATVTIIDNDAPVVSEVAVPADGLYGIDGNLDFTLTFTDFVTTTGTPQIPITIGSETVNAELLAPVSNSLTAVFRYTIVEGNNDLDGITVGTDIILNGGTIVGTNSTLDAILTLNSVGSTANVNVDGIRPVPTVTSSAPDPTNAPYIATITFDEPVTDFVMADLDVANGTPSLFNPISSTVYEVTITPDSDGGVIVFVPFDVALDAAGNGNDISNELFREFDGTNPTAVISTIAADPINMPFTVDIVFDEDVFGFEMADLVVTNGTPSNFTVVTATTEFSVLITPTGAGPVFVDIPAAVAEDLATNPNNAATFEIEYDNIPPLPPNVTHISDYTCSGNVMMTGDNTLEISGTAERESTVEVFLDGISIGTVVADADTGFWNFDYTGTVLADGTYTFTAQATDTAINTGALSAGFTITINTVDSDGDGNPDFCDDDDNGNGSTDVEEDCDGDGIVDSQDTDNSSCQIAIQQTRSYGFSPNGDGVNDGWVIENITAFPNNVVQVFNRSGKLVFKQNGYQNDWEAISNQLNGNTLGRRLPVGPYIYVIDLGDGSAPVRGWLYINY